MQWQKTRADKMERGGIKDPVGNKLLLLGIASAILANLSSSELPETNEPIRIGASFGPASL
jgi:hypothetical protein